MTLRDTLFEPDESDRGVSPVIGVILMVAITVILAAVIGTFVLEIGQNTGSTAPSASLSFSDTSNGYDQTVSMPDDGSPVNQEVVEFDHNNGEDLDAENLRIVIRNNDNAIVGEWQQGSWGTQLTTDKSGALSTETWTLVLNGQDTAFNSNNFESTTISTGDRVVLRADLADDGSVSETSDPSYDVTIQDVPDDSDLRVQIIDTESGNQIGSGTVEVK